MKSNLVCLIILGLFSTFSIVAQTERGAIVKPKESAANVEKRLALVIGNSAYANTTALGNPANDATDMAQTLKELGFEVIFGTNQTLPQMRKLIREFGTKLQTQKGVGLFYFAGHGIQFAGKNFLIPVDAQIESEVETEDAGIDLNTILRQMDYAGNGFNIVILDACRNNPFARSWRGYRDTGSSGGLARVDAPTGTLIAYATKPGETASDGTGNNGLYTSALLKQMRVKNVDVTKMFQRVRAEVIAESKGKQIPFDESSVVGDFYFAGSYASENPAQNSTQSVIIAPQIGEREAWNQIKDSKNRADFALFIESFPHGVYAKQAQANWEQAWWNSIKNSADKSDYATFLKQFPNGQYESAARFALKRIEIEAAALPDVSEIKLVFKAISEKVSVEATIDGKKSSMEISPESPKTFEAQQILKLRYYRGFADKVQIILNGKQIQPPGVPQKNNGIEFEINKLNIIQILQNGRIL